MQVSKAKDGPAKPNGKLGTLAGIIETTGSTGSVFVPYPGEPWFDEYGDFKYELLKMAKDYCDCA